MPVKIEIKDDLSNDKCYLSFTIGRIFYDKYIIIIKYLPILPHFQDSLVILFAEFGGETILHPWIIPRIYPVNNSIISISD